MRAPYVPYLLMAAFGLLAVVIRLQGKTVNPFSRKQVKCNNSLIPKDFDYSKSTNLSCPISDIQSDEVIYVPQPGEKGEIAIMYNLKIHSKTIFPERSAHAVFDMYVHVHDAKTKELLHTFHSTDDNVETNFDDNAIISAQRELALIPSNHNFKSKKGGEAGRSILLGADREVYYRIKFNSLSVYSGQKAEFYIVDQYSTGRYLFNLGVATRAPHYHLRLLFMTGTFFAVLLVLLAYLYVLVSGGHLRNNISIYFVLILHLIALLYAEPFSFRSGAFGKFEDLVHYKHIIMFVSLDFLVSYFAIIVNLKAFSTKLASLLFWLIILFDVVSHGFRNAGIQDSIDDKRIEWRNGYYSWSGRANNDVVGIIFMIKMVVVTLCAIFMAFKTARGSEYYKHLFGLPVVVTLFNMFINKHMMAIRAEQNHTGLLSIEYAFLPLLLITFQVLSLGQSTDYSLLPVDEKSDNIWKKTLRTIVQ